MSPADSFMWAVVAASALTLFISTVIPTTLRGLVTVGHKIQPLSRPIAAFVAAVLLVGVVRSSPSAAVVPPPTERVIVEGDRASALAAVNPISEIVLGSGAGQVHTVVAGDTLWGIARNILDEREAAPAGAEIAAAWKMIYSANVDVVGSDPNLILPGQVLTIPGGIHG